MALNSSLASPPAAEGLPAAENTSVFQEALKIQHRWPWATWTAQLFPHSAWWAARQSMIGLAPAAPHAPAASPTKVGSGRVLFVADQALAEASLALLARMAAAMQIPAENFAIWPNAGETSWQAMADRFQPRIILALGSAALEMLVGRRERLSQIHGTLMSLSYGSGSCTMMPIFHPDFLLINPAMKRPVWQDLQKVMRFLAE